MLTRAELKRMSRFQLMGKWGLVIVTSVVLFAVATVGAAFVGVFRFIPVMGFLVSLAYSFAVMPALIMGLNAFYLKLSRGEDASVNDLFSKLSLWAKALGLMLLMGLFVCLWMLLFIIPGYIAAYRYRQALYILLDNPEISPMEAISRSKEIMKGQKMRLFVLDLSFLGWAVLCLFTFGIGYLWLVPYMSVTDANFYNNLISGGNTAGRLDRQYQ